MDRPRLLFTFGFLAGFVLMSLEILAWPLLLPLNQPGSNVMSSIVMVFILSMALGYYLGGRLADRFPAQRLLAPVFFLSGLFVLTIPSASETLILALGVGKTCSEPIFLAITLLLFLPPTFSIGMLSPILLKLLLISGREVGQRSGVFYAWGALGNVVGISITNFGILNSVDSLFGFWLDAAICMAVSVFCALLWLYEQRGNRKPQSRPDAPVRPLMTTSQAGLEDTHA